MGIHGRGERLTRDRQSELGHAVLEVIICEDPVFISISVGQGRIVSAFGSVRLAAGLRF